MFFWPAIVVSVLGLVILVISILHISARLRGSRAWRWRQEVLALQHALVAVQHEHFDRLFPGALRRRLHPDVATTGFQA